MTRTIHDTALIDDVPPQTGALAKPIPPDMPPCLLGDGVTVGPFACIQRDVVVGDGTLVGHYASIFYGSRIGKNCIIGRAVQIGYNVTIGDNVKILDGAHICGETKIGDGTIIAMHVMTGNDRRPLGWEWKGVQGITIGKNCQIGYAACINPGLVIGDGAIVMTNATVTKDVPPGATVRGPKPEMILPEVAA